MSTDSNLQLEEALPTDPQSQLEHLADLIERAEEAKQKARYYASTLSGKSFASGMIRMATKIVEQRKIDASRPSLPGLE